MNIKNRLNAPPALTGRAFFCFFPQNLAGRLVLAAAEGSNYTGMQKEPPTDEVMDYRGLSAYLKMAQGTLRHKVMRGEIPHFKVGHSVRFSKKQIGLWLEEHHQGQRKKKAGDSGNGLLPIGGGEA
jgi:excisionase family DNA binding protein